MLSEHCKVGMQKPCKMDRQLQNIYLETYPETCWLHLNSNMHSGEQWYLAHCRNMSGWDIKPLPVTSDQERAIFLGIFYIFSPGLLGRTSSSNNVKTLLKESSDRKYILLSKNHVDYFNFVYRNPSPFLCHKSTPIRLSPYHYNCYTCSLAASGFFFNN